MTEIAILRMLGYNKVTDALEKYIKVHTCPKTDTVRAMAIAQDLEVNEALMTSQVEPDDYVGLPIVREDDTHSDKG